MQIVPKAASNDPCYDDWLDITDPRSKEEEKEKNPVTQPEIADINDAFDSITLNCFDEYAKDTKEPTSTIPKKKEHPYKSKKNKGKGKK